MKQNLETGEIAQSVVKGMEVEFSDEETKRLIDDSRFRMAAYLYRLATRHAAHEDSLAIDHRARTQLERAVREHAQRVIGEHEATHAQPDH